MMGCNDPTRPEVSGLPEAALRSIPRRKPVSLDDLSRLRNVVLAGHAGSGKTTLAEHLLHATGAISRLGRVDDGTASLDWEPEEQKRRLSLSLAVATLQHDGHRITLIDTPGYADFVGEVIEGFTAVDGALFYDAGKVASRTEDLNLRDLESDYGFGFRFGSANGVFLRIDTAFGSRDGVHFIFRFNNVF